jgi:hypothetical protein
MRTTKDAQAGSLERSVRLWWNNWKRARRGALEWRRELKRDGEINMLITSYVFAPLMWFMAVAAVTYFTLKEPNDKALPQGGAKKGNDEH